MFNIGYGNQTPFDGQSFTNVPTGIPVQGGNYNTSGQQQYQNAFPMTPNLGVLGQPVVQDMAMQYGQHVCSYISVM